MPHSATTQACTAPRTLRYKMEKDLFLMLKEASPRGRILTGAPLSDFTSFRTGGPADYVVIPSDEDGIRNIILLAKANEIPYYIIGNGTNLLVSDDGFRGIVVVIKEGKADISYDERDEEVLVKAHAGAPLTKVAYDAARRGLAGFEFAAGIPGSVGGAVFMNAGAYGGEIKDVIVSARVMDTEGNIFDMDRDGLELSYRHSAVGEKGLIVLEAVFALKRGDTEAILAAISELNAKRREKQPLEYPSAGSTFKRPEGYFAGNLIEEAGLKGYSVGDACVSEKHCGFVINKGRATSSDIIKLIHEVSDRVYRNSGVRLEPEVRMIGFD